MSEIREHYELEVFLANQLRKASREQRRHLYAPLYDELFRKIAYFNEPSRGTDEEISVLRQFSFLRRFLKSTDHYLEIGAGKCNLTNKVADVVNTAYALDVSEELFRNISTGQNVKLVLSDGISVPIPAGTIDIAYSHQLMEHLLPEDAVLQLGNIFTALKPGGKYICITPNGINGPHDVSKWYDSTAKGFHLREYDTGELYNLFKSVGFRKVLVLVGPLNSAIPISVVPVVLLESLLKLLPSTMRTTVGRMLPIRLLLGIKLIGVK